MGDGAAGGWRAWLVRDGRLRPILRLALFIVLLFTLLLALLLPAWALAPALFSGDDLIVALAAQSALVLIAALAAEWLTVRWTDPASPALSGWTITGRLSAELGSGFGIGIAAIVAVVAVGWAATLYGFVGEPGTAAGWLAAMLASLAWLTLPAAAEEAVFRGYPFRVLREAGGATTAVLVTSVLFALVHGANPGVGPLALINIFLAGVLLAVAVLRTGSLWFATALHLGWNWATAGLLDLPVSGLEAFDPPLYDAQVGVGPVWLNGGGFGPEGGLAGTVAALVALGTVVVLTRPGRRLARSTG